MWLSVRAVDALTKCFSLRVLAEKAREYNTPLYLCFVDLRKAYDSVSRDALWVVPQKRYRVPGTLLRILKSSSYGFSNSPPTVKCQRSFPSRMVCDREMCWPLLSSISSSMQSSPWH